MWKYWETGKEKAQKVCVKCIALDGVWLSNEEVLKTGCYMPEIDEAYWLPDVVHLWDSFSSYRIGSAASSNLISKEVTKI
jgi:hypothetical protein